MVDIGDLKSPGLRPCGFESHLPHMGYIWFRLRLSPAKEASRAEFESQILQGETGVGLIMFRHDVGLSLNPFFS